MVPLAMTRFSAPRDSFKTTLSVVGTDDQEFKACTGFDACQPVLSLIPGPVSSSRIYILNILELGLK